MCVMHVCICIYKERESINTCTCENMTLLACHLCKCVSKLQKRLETRLIAHLLQGHHWRGRLPVLLLLCQPVLHLVETAEQRKREREGGNRGRQRDLNKQSNSALRYTCCGMLHGLIKVATDRNN